MTTLTLLLDLDDTLLDNDQNAFFAAFARTMLASLGKYGEPQVLAAGFQEGVQAMFTNRDPARTLSAAFYEHFLARLPRVDEASVRADVDAYYRDAYPRLQEFTRPRAAAINLVDWAFGQGYQVAIATNPVFTHFAVEERLRWAGLPPERYHFALLTSNESFHFAKSPAYFAEIMGRLGWPEGPVVMVGDDLQLDVLPAKAAGLAAFHVTTNGNGSSAKKSVQHGKIESLRPWLETADFHKLKGEPNSREAILATLLATPAALAGLLEKVPATQWTRRPSSEEWSITEILCHLRDVDTDVNLPRLRTFLEETNPFIIGQMPDDWVKERAYDRQDGRQALRDLTEERKSLVATLEALSPQNWRLRARHSIFGPTDLREMAGFIADHDRSHLQQVFKTIEQVAEPSI